MPERGSKTSTVPFVRANFGIFSLGAIQKISCRDLWPWTKPGYITVTRKRSNNQWSGGIAAHPATPQKIASAKIRCKSSRFDFLGPTASSTLFIFQKAKLSTRSVTHLCWCNWRTFWRKNAAGRKGYNAPLHRALATQKKLAYLAFQYIDHPPYSPDLAPSEYHLFPELKKNNWKVAIFRPTRRSLLLRRPGWTDNLLIFFFEWPAKVRAKG